MKNEPMKKKNFSLKNINNIVKKANKTTLFAFILIYAVILLLALNLVNTDMNYIVEPNYNHVTYNNEISPQISFYTTLPDIEDPSRLTYSVVANINGRLVDGVDPKYKINSFRMFAATKAKIDSEKVNNMYYFTEHTTYQTPIQHSYTIYGDSKGQNPSSFYVRLQYATKEGNDEKIATFKEQVMLQPSASDIESLNKFYDEKSKVDDKYVSVISVGNNSGVVDLKQTYDPSEDKQTASVRVLINDKMSKKYHVDMQMWVVSNTGVYYPYIGVYNYTSQTSTFTSLDRKIEKSLNCEYLAMKVIYKDGDGQTVESFYKQKLRNIQEGFTSNPGVDAQIKIAKDNSLLKTVLVVLGGFVVVGAVTIGTYFVVKKKDEKNK